MNRFTYGLFSIILIGFLLAGCLQTAAKKIGSEDKNVTNPVKKLIETTEDIIGKVVKNETAAGTPEKITKTENTGNAKISGTVTAENGSALSGMDVSAYEQYATDGKIYRIFKEEKKTGNDGKFSFKVDGGKKYFISASGYLKIGEKERKYYKDSFVYAYDEKPKTLGTNENWTANIVMKFAGEKKTFSVQGYGYSMEVKYYYGDEQCSRIALNYLQDYYPKVKDTIGLKLPNEKIVFEFNTIPEQGSGDWTTDKDGISTVCYPWTDKVQKGEESSEGHQIKEMWETAIPHEMTHYFVSGFASSVVPYWANEGLADYTQFTINGETPDCSKEKLVPIENMKGENLPQYRSAACVWYLLEQEKPGFVKAVMQKIKETSESGKAPKKSGSGYFIKGILSSVYGSDLKMFFVKNWGFDANKIESEYAEAAK